MANHEVGTQKLTYAVRRRRATHIFGVVRASGPAELQSVVAPFIEPRDCEFAEVRRAAFLACGHLAVDQLDAGLRFEPLLAGSVSSAERQAA